MALASMAGLAMMVVLDKKGPRWRAILWVVASLVIGIATGCLAMRVYLMYSIGLPLVFTEIFEPPGPIPTRNHPDL